MKINLNKESQYIFFVGAGISSDSPSNFPLSEDIIKKIIDLISPNVELKRLLYSLSKHTRSNKRYSNDYLRFEQLIDLLQQYADPSLSILDFIDLYTIPNDNHYFLASRAIKGDSIITTNFDCLIEKAVLEYGFLPQTICNDEDFIDFKKNKDLIPIFKIHGSFRKYNGKKYKKSISSIKATLSSISIGSKTLSLPEGKKIFLKNTLLKRQLIVAGYSGLDDLDIIPSLYETNPESIYWLMHTQNNRAAYVKNDFFKKLFLNIEDTELSSRDKLFKHFTNTNSRKFVVIETHTHTFLKNIFSYKSKFVEEPDSISRRVFDRFLLKWQETVSDRYIKYLLIGEILRTLSRYPDAKKYLYRAWETLYNNSSSSSLIAFAISRVLIYLGDRENALKWSKKSIELLKQNTPCRTKANCWHTLGVALYSNGKLNDAEVWYKKCISYCRKKELKAILSYTYHDLAIIYHDRGVYDIAEKYYNYSINLSELEGDLRHVAFSQHQLGTLKYELGCFSESKNHLLEAYRISYLVGDYDGYGNALYELSLLEYLRGNLHGCIDSIREVIRINKLTHRNEYTPIFWQQLGIAYLELNNKKAIYYLEKAKKGYLKLNDLQNLVELKCYYSYYYLLIGNEKKALLEAETSLRLARKIEIKNYFLRARFMAYLSRLILNRYNFRTNYIISVINETFQVGAKDLLLDQIYYLSKFNLLANICNNIYEIVLYVKDNYEKLNNRERIKIIDKALINNITLH